MGLPTATQVMFRSALFFTSYWGSGWMVKCGGTRRTESKQNDKLGDSLKYFSVTYVHIWVQFLSVMGKQIRIQKAPEYGYESRKLLNTDPESS